MSAIFKRELRAFFTSPIGYVFLAAFLTILNFLFYQFNVRGSSSDLAPLFPVMTMVFMVIVPFLTMRLFSEEFKMRTDQMLLTAPVSVWGVVMGKFWAAFAVLILALIGTLTWPVIVAANVSLDVLATIGCYVAILFAGAAFLALGIFISSLTESQIIAAICTFAVFFGILLLDSLSAQFSSVPWLQMIIGWFSLFSRFNSFSMGVFSLADIIYYISFTFVFLFLTTRILEKKRWS